MVWLHILSDISFLSDKRVGLRLPFWAIHLFIGHMHGSALILLGDISFYPTNAWGYVYPFGRYILLLDNCMGLRLSFWAIYPFIGQLRGSALILLGDISFYPTNAWVYAYPFGRYIFLS